MPNDDLDKNQNNHPSKDQVAVDDWLFNDPLGLNAFGEEQEDEQDNEQNNGQDESILEDDLLKSTFSDELLSNPHSSDLSNHTNNHLDKTTMNDISDNDINTHTTTDAMATDIMINSMTTDKYEPAAQDVAPTDLPIFDGDTSRANPNFRPLLPKPIHRQEANRQLIMDTETTGLDPTKGDRIIEVGIVEMVNRKFTGEKLHVYINPLRGMDEVVIRIHGISEAFLTDKPTFDQIAKPLYDFMDGAELIAHNAPFDISFLSMEFNKVGITDFEQRVKVTDSLAMAKQQYPGQRNTLDALVRRLDVGKQDRTFHGALLDSEILAEVYLAMTGGQVTLAIEEDSQTDGAPTAHANFAHLAALLLESTVDNTTNQSWFATLAKDYPEIQAKMSN